MKTVIVDDEQKSRILLENLLAVHCPHLKVVQQCASVEEALIAVDNHEPSLVFLDIEMPVHNGFVLLERIKNPSFKVIFTTAYDKYAIRAIRFSALDYLLKPVDTDELKAAVDKVQMAHPAQTRAAYEVLLSNLKGKEAKIGVPTFEGIQMLNTADIIKFMASGSYTDIFLINGSKLTVSRILKEYEDLLTDLNFLRIHNSYLINLAHVKKYIKGEGGYVQMCDGQTCEVSRRKKAELLSRLNLL